MSRLCADIVQRVDELSHVRMEQVAVSFAQARKRDRYGVRAKLTPLRFEGGALVTTRYGRRWTIQRYYRGDCEVLYIATFYLPRFLDLSFREKLVTVMHELYHISPEFNGDLRRFGGRYHAHSRSVEYFDRKAEELADAYLQTEPPPEVYGFLKRNFRQLYEDFGGIVGMKIPVPKLIPLDDADAA